jgi:hypothetical protein
MKVSTHVHCVPRVRINGLIPPVSRTSWGQLYFVYRWLYSPFFGSGRFFSSLIFYTVRRIPWTGSVRLMDATYNWQHKHRRNADRHPCLKWDSNPRLQCLREWRYFVPWTEQPLCSASPAARICRWPLLAPRPNQARGSFRFFREYNLWPYFWHCILSEKCLLTDTDMLSDMSATEKGCETILKYHNATRKMAAGPMWHTETQLIAVQQSWGKWRHSDFIWIMSLMHIL